MIAVTARDTTQPVDWLDSYAALRRWAALSELAVPIGPTGSETDSAEA